MHLNSYRNMQAPQWYSNLVHDNKKEQVHHYKKNWIKRKVEKQVIVWVESIVV